MKPISWKSCRTPIPPVCKIINFGKFKYELAKKDKLQKKHQHVSLLKELRFHPNTDVHDFEFKTRHARQFLADGHKVKATVVFKGREITYKEKGEVLLARFVEAGDRHLQGGPGGAHGRAQHDHDSRAREEEKDVETKAESKGEEPAVSKTAGKAEEPAVRKPEVRPTAG